jgi:photosystem II stability/assembly factor-like uncharacterized protein
VKLVAIDFASPDDGWAVGAFGTILRTSNGGDTWTTQGADVTLGISLAGVSFTDNQSGWAIAERGRVIFRTVDGGGAWTRENFPSDSPRSEMQFIDRNHGWVILNQGGVLHTSDGGLNWEHQPVTGVGLSGGFFINEQTGWIAGWRRKSSGIQISEFLVDGTAARTTNGGSTWTTHDSGTGNFLFGVAFVTPLEGWAVGGLGTLLYSSDGGVTWTPQHSGTQETLRKVVFPNENTGWAIGSNGVALKFTRDRE